MRRIVLIAFALMVLVPSVAFARSEYVCRLDGRVRPACCCPTRAQPQDASRAASVRAACCCTVSESAPSRAQPATEDDRPGSRAHQPALVAVAAPYAPAVRVTIAEVAPLPRSTAPPDRHRDRFVRHCALLL